MKNKNT
ncbi:hypothetical protein RDI58_028485 [Solanum bulbocastanum]